MNLFMRAACYRAGGLILCLVLAGCAGTPQSDRLILSTPQEFLQPVMNRDVPFFPQEAYQCGPAALAMLLNAQGLDVTPTELTDQVYIPARRGSLQLEIVATTRRYGLLPYELQPEMAEILAEVKAGRPVLVFQNLGVSWYPQWHFAVVVGYDLPEEKLILHSGTTKSYRSSIYTFERTWQRSHRWAMVALRPGEMPVNPEHWRYVRASVGLEQVKKPDIASLAYRAGLQKWPRSKELNMAMGNYFYTQGKLQQAGDYYRNVINNHADFAPAYNNLAQVLLEQGDIEGALVHAQTAVKIGGTHTRQYQQTLDEIKHSRANER